VKMFSADNGNASKLEVYGGDDRIEALTKKVLGNSEIISLTSIQFQ
jgi:hypothetical protein